MWVSCGLEPVASDVRHPNIARFSAEGFNYACPLSLWVMKYRRQQVQGTGSAAADTGHWCGQKAHRMAENAISAWPTFSSVSIIAAFVLETSLNGMGAFICCFQMLAICSFRTPSSQ